MISHKYGFVAPKQRTGTLARHFTDTLHLGMVHKGCWTVHRKLRWKMNLELPMTTNVSLRFLRRAKFNKLRYGADSPRWKWKLRNALEANNVEPRMRSG